jgi:PKD repeat protein
VGVAVTFAGTGSSDVDGSIVSYAWDFGDGTTGSGVSPTHTYAAAGTFTVSLTVTDDGGATDVATQLVTVAAASLEVTTIEPGSVDAGSFVDVDITGSGFAPGVAVTVENGSGPAPEVSNVVRQSDNLITATITAKSGGPRRDRPWDVRVTNPDGTSVVVVGGLIVGGAW